MSHEKDAYDHICEALRSLEKVKMQFRDIHSDLTIIKQHLEDEIW